MQKPIRYILTVGTFFVLGGVVSSIAGGLAMARFFQDHPSPAGLTVAQLFWGLMIPHILLLAGVGVTVYGVILVTRGISLNRRLTHHDPPSGPPPPRR